MTSPTDLDALDALLAKATPGEWQLSFQTDNEVSIDTGPERRLGYASWKGMATVFGSDDDDAGNEIMENNAALIVALHNQYPVLAAELRALRAERDRLREALAALTNGPLYGFGAADVARAALKEKPHD